MGKRTRRQETGRAIGDGSTEFAQPEVSIRKVLRSIWPSVAVICVFLTSSLQAATAQESMTGVNFVAMVTDTDSPGDVQLTGVTIVGDVNFRSVPRIDRPIRCSGCEFTGSFHARDITFGAIVEFSESTFGADVDLQGASFERSAVFDRSRFEGTNDFRSIRFGDLASFNDALFRGTVRFDRTVFANRAVFTSSNPVVDRANNACDQTQSAFFGEVSFSGASFADRVDFRRRCFQATTSFVNASFDAAVDYTLASFIDRTTFEQAAFAGGSDFRVSDFYSHASFEEATTSESVDFSGATFRGRMAFNGFSGSGVLSIDDIEAVGTDVLFEMNDVSVSFLVFEPEKIALVGGPAIQADVLEKVAATAKTTGDIGLANDAQYELLSLESEDLGPVARTLDLVFYRTIAGYLVRPLHPFWSLVIFLTLAATIRVVHSQVKRGHPVKSGDTKTSTSPRPKHGAVLLGADVFAGYAAALSTAWSRRSGQTVPEYEEGPKSSVWPYVLALLLFLEWLTYRILIALIVIGIANSIPVVHDLIDAIF